jgi:lysophospholipase L1-like esterase
MSRCGFRLTLPLIAIASSLSLGACGGGGGPSGPSSPPPVTTYPVGVTVFYDENGNGQLDGGEIARLPNVEVVAGSGSARTDRGSGRAVVQAPAGAQLVAIRTETLPPGWVPTAGVTVDVPGTSEVRLPVRLPIGNNHPNVYVTFGDSLTVGVGSATGAGYNGPLQAQLGASFGTATVVASGRDGTFSTTGAARIPGVMNRERPAYTLILYGTNDWNDQRCQSVPPASCYTIDNLRIIVEYVKSQSSIPVLGTLPPASPTMAPPERTQWNAQMNDLIKSLARSEGAMLADLFAAFPSNAADRARYFSDDVHPNDAGYALIAEGFLKAFTTGRAASASGGDMFFGLSSSPPPVRRGR